MIRGLNILFQDGYKTCISLPPFEGSELQSTREVLNALQKHSDSIKRFRDRKPILRHTGNWIKMDSVDEALHTLLNARKHIEIVMSDATLMDQLFHVDFINNTITLYKGKTERGTMKLDFFYSNWESLFYPEELMDELSKPFIEEEFEKITSDDVESDKHSNTGKMEDVLDPVAFDLWHYIYNELPGDETPFKVVIEYSGSGDSGNIDSILVYTDEYNYDDSEDREISSRAWDVIDSKESGFVNNDGGRGEIIITDHSFQWNHFNYYTDENQTVSDHISLDSESKSIELPF